ncbi:copper chaperone PCu(A)C [Xenophilus sp.]|uniref:copper chaperone PCu(A)C n=1 Tax=Xenophilus sp. TaxID=1873499 RepID=UPI0037DC5205
MNKAASVVSMAVGCVLWSGCAGAWARVVLASVAEAAAGSRQDVVLRVDAPCPDATRTEGLSVQLPWGFRLAGASPRPGWTAGVRDAVHKNGPLGYPGSVHWRAATPGDALHGSQPADFVLQGRLPWRPRVLAFDVRQFCDGGRHADWRVQLGAAAPPAASVAASQAWLRATAPGRRDAALFVRLQSARDLRLVGAASPAAGRVELQWTLQSKLKGLQLREADAPLDLPAGRAVNLVPGVAHLAMQALASPLAAGEEVDVTLRFEDAAGATSELPLRVPVREGPLPAPPGPTAGRLE